MMIVWCWSRKFKKNNLKLDSNYLIIIYLLHVIIYESEMKKFTTLLLIAGILTGCATEMETQPDPETEAYVRTLAILALLVEQSNQQQTHQKQQRDDDRTIFHAQEQQHLMIQRQIQEQQQQQLIQQQIQQQQMQQQQLHQQQMMQQQIHQQMIHHHHTPGM